MSRTQRAKPRAPRARADGPQSRARGPHLGPLRITPLRVTLGIALAGGLAFLAWSVLVRDANQAFQVPMMATGFFVCGIVLAVVALLSLGKVVSAGREGRDGRAVLTALAGGVLAAIALLMLAGAVIMSLIWTGTKAS
ncbi:MAG TPA: hypothetical protein VIR16_02130 [Candidatus Limnocylindrales bacterium]